MIAPPGPAAVTVIFEEHTAISGGLTVTVKLQMLELPQESVATQVTVFVPTGKLLPLRGLQFTTAPLQPPLVEEV